MAEPAVRRTSPSAADQSIGDLVSVAARDISQLVRYEVDLAKLELRSDIRRAGISAGLLAVAVFAACLVLMLLSFAFAFGLSAIGAPGGLWGAFLWVALACVVFIMIVALAALLIVRRVSRMGKTRRSLAESASLLRHVKSTAKATARVG